MKQNERILVCLVTGFLAVILVVAVMFGRDASALDKAQAGAGAKKLDALFGAGASDAKPAAAPGGEVTGNGTVAGLASPEQVAGQQKPLAAGRLDLVASMIAQHLGPSRRERMVRFVHARAGDSLETLVRRWCGARDPYLEEAKSLNEELTVVRLGKEVAVPWVDDEVVLAAFEASQPKRLQAEPAAAAAGDSVSAAFEAALRPAAGGAPAGTTFAQPAVTPLTGSPANGATSNGAGAVALPNTQPYTVKPGDSLWRIAARLYGQKEADRKIAEIRRLNPGQSDTLRPGQKILVPAVDGPAPVPAPSGA